MACHPYQLVGSLSTAAYGQRVTGVGPTYMERLKEQVSFGECGDMLAAGSLSSHMMTQHGRAAEIRQQWSTPAAGIGTQTYRVSLPAKGGPQKCPLAGCTGRVVTRTAIWVNFVHRNFLDTVVIMEEGNSPHPRCTRCNMMFLRRALNRRHPGTAQCKKGRSGRDDGWQRQRRGRVRSGPSRPTGSLSRMCRHLNIWGEC